MFTDGGCRRCLPRLGAAHCWCLAVVIFVAIAIAACGAGGEPRITTSTPPPAGSPTGAADLPTPTQRPAETPSVATATPAPPATIVAPTTLPVTEVASSPTSVPATGTAEPTIHTFTANVDIADPGDTITMTWHWSGGNRASIYHLWPTGQLMEPDWEIEPTGSVQYTIDPGRRNSDLFVLFVIGANEGVVAQKTLAIPLRCPDEWFFEPAPDICPAGSAIGTDAAQQQFERGIMLWNGTDGLIYVLFDDEQHSKWHVTADQWEEGDAPSDPEIVPPSGFYQPVRGFGLVWREHASVRERLGWAVAPEEGYRGAVQRTSHVRYSDTYIRAFDGGVWRLRPNGSAWEYVETTHQ